MKRGSAGSPQSSQAVEPKVSLLHLRVLEFQISSSDPFLFSFNMAAMYYSNQCGGAPHLRLCSEVVSTCGNGARRIVCSLLFFTRLEEEFLYETLEPQVYDQHKRSRKDIVLTSLVYR